MLIQSVATRTRMPTREPRNGYVGVIIRCWRKGKPLDVERLLQPWLLEVGAIDRPLIDPPDDEGFILDGYQGTDAVSGDELRSADLTLEVGSHPLYQVEVGRLIDIPETPERANRFGRPYAIDRRVTEESDFRMSGT